MISVRRALPFVFGASLLAQGATITYGVGCAASAARATGYAPNPGAGRILMYELSVPTGAVPIALLGFSASQWGGVALPLPLDGLGVPGCALLAEPAIANATLPLASGVAEYSLEVPGDASLVGIHVYGQWMNWGDASVSTTFPITLTNAVEFTLGPVVGMPGFVVTGNPTGPTGATWTYVATVGGVAYDLTGRLYKPTTLPTGGYSLYPAVVISHGFGGNANGYSANIANTMRSWGLVCIMTNLTHAAGVPLGSPGLATERGASAANVLRNRKCVDLLQALGYVDARRLAAHGHSMGAFATGALLGTHPDVFTVGSHTGAA